MTVFHSVPGQKVHPVLGLANLGLLRTAFLKTPRHAGERLGSVSCTYLVRDLSYGRSSYHVGVTVQVIRSVVG